MMLTEDQISVLYQFCRKHSVSYYDLQVELVDHLANAIEEKINDDNSLSFETVLDSLYASFGIKGFSNIVKKKIAALKREHRRRIWTTFLSFFKWPFILFTSSFLLAEFLCYQYFGIEITIVAFIAFSVASISILLFRIIHNKRKQLQPLPANDFMHVPLSNSFTLGVQVSAFLLNLAQIYLNSISKIHDNSLLNWLISGNILMLFEISFLLAFRANQDYLQKQYSVAFE